MGPPQNLLCIFRPQIEIPVVFKAQRGNEAIVLLQERLFLADVHDMRRRTKLVRKEELRGFVESFLGILRPPIPILPRKRGENMLADVLLGFFDHPVHCCPRDVEARVPLEVSDLPNNPYKLISTESATYQ